MQKREVEIDIKGHIFRGYYIIERKVITVFYGTDKKSSMIHTTAENEARLLLQEIIEGIS